MSSKVSTKRAGATRLALLRLTVSLSLLFSITYITWRWLYSLNMHAWWIAVPLVVAESYSIIDSAFFGFTVWNAKPRPRPPKPNTDLSVDVFITTYNEPVDIVIRTAQAALQINYPHKTWILDDGARQEMRDAAEKIGVGYITRSKDWNNQPRHAKAGNVNNALMQTDGEFILILDSDMVPFPEILDNTLGYFNDPQIALVQTPQEFGNVTTEDPLGSQAPLFYGPIQQGKDAWNAAYFCGSNAILRREALMQLGLKRYVIEIETSTKKALNGASNVIKKAKKDLGGTDAALSRGLTEIAEAIEETKDAIKNGAMISEATYDLHRKIQEISTRLVSLDVENIKADLLFIESLEEKATTEESSVVQEKDFNEHWCSHIPTEELLSKGDEIEKPDLSLDILSQRDMSPFKAIETVSKLLASIDIHRAHEAFAVMPLATISITEDMATSMRLHEMKWKSVYHHELLAIGLAPEDMGAMLTQRLRWAQGTIQVLLLENPLIQKGLTWAQRVMYFSTMWSYFSGFAAVVYFSGPIIFLCFGILPVTTSPSQFFLHFFPFMIANQCVFLFASRGVSTWRGQQYSYALFPVWIKAVVSGFANVIFHQSLTFAVTPKTNEEHPIQWRLIRYQLLFAGAFILAMAIGIFRYFTHQAPLLATAINVMWVLFDLSLLKVLIPAVLYKGYQPNASPIEGRG